MNWKAAAKSFTVWVNLAIVVAGQLLTDPTLLAQIPPEWMPRIIMAQGLINLALRYKTTGAIRR